jgi:Ubiquitin-conjugating enzyme
LHFAILPVQRTPGRQMEGQYNARNPAVKRLFREAQELSDNPDEDFHAAPLEDNLFEWHFTIRGPADTPFENGLYHGSCRKFNSTQFRPFLNLSEI